MAGRLKRMLTVGLSGSLIAALVCICYLAFRHVLLHGEEGRNAIDDFEMLLAVSLVGGLVGLVVEDFTPPVAPPSARARRTPDGAECARSPISEPCWRIVVESLAPT